MKCREMLKLLNDYVEDNIDPEFCKEFEAHMAKCNPCQVVVNTLRNTIQLYQEEKQVAEMPLPFRDRLHDTLRRRWDETH
jgi:hypothetical protein